MHNPIQKNEIAGEKWERGCLAVNTPTETKLFLNDSRNVGYTK
jgi:hypothetical protein